MECRAVLRYATAIEQQKSKIKNIKTAIGWVIGIASVGLCAAAIIGYWDKFDPWRYPIRPALFSAAIACTLAGLCLHGLGWFVLMRGMAPGLSFSSAMRAWAYSQVVKYVPGKVMVFVTRTEICGREGIAPLTVLAGTGLEIILSLICAMVLSLGTVTVWLRNSGLSPWVCVLPLAGLLAMVHPKVIMAVMRLYYRLRKADTSSVPKLDLKHILQPMAVYFMGWLLYGVGGYLLVRVIVAGFDGSPSAMIGVIGAFPFAWAAGYLVILAPGGAGFREGALVYALGSWLSFELAIVVAVAARMCQSGLDLLIAGGWWAGRTIALRRSK
ncbi:MAG: lysylphosphatidylglycerol synthase domain-containing protein [Phycisphaerae bacterium]|nr:lysylphosphatidylglycerol synthase domain-containing protein [Phycisphaerae bacterium]